MADIELVIKISEDLYKAYKGRQPSLGDVGMDMIAQSITTGKPLPKGHGDLIDRKELEMYGSWQMQIIPEGNGKYVETRIYTQRAVDAVQTIIPADKEASE